MRVTEREAKTQAERSRLLAGSPRWDSILGPGSCPELKADAQPLSHPGVPKISKFLKHGMHSIKK